PPEILGKVILVMSGQSRKMYQYLDPKPEGTILPKRSTPQEVGQLSSRHCCQYRKLAGDQHTRRWAMSRPPQAQAPTRPQGGPPWVDAIDRQPETGSTKDGPRPPIEPLLYRLDDLTDALRVSRRTLERERSAGRLPRPDLHIGK